ncbi:hypothetical protein GGI12_000068 [Dipsacomyces acuminosporus]|nr:hypothetical protein GGI12_000068 [Dipsacomyces acuminosporus]
MYIPASKSPYIRPGGGAIVITPSSLAPSSKQKRQQQPKQPATSYAPPPVVRKNSGEIVRSCLRRRANTEPCAPSGTAGIRPPRFVHFGTELERVRWFLKAQCPKSASTDATPEGLGGVSDEEHISSAHQQQQQQQPATVRLTSIRRPSPSFSIFETAPVVLERVELACSRREHASLKGTVKVHNIAFEKKVVLRYSFDNWRTAEECQAAFTKTMAEPEGGRPGVDRFSFTLSLPTAAIASLPVTVAMCARYNVGDSEYWDNNHGSNYIFKITHPAVPAIADEEADVDTVATRPRAQSYELRAPPRLTFSTHDVAHTSSPPSSASYSIPTPADTNRYMARSAALFGSSPYRSASFSAYEQYLPPPSAMDIDSGTDSPSLVLQQAPSASFSSSPNTTGIVSSARHNQPYAYNMPACTKAIAAQPPGMQYQQQQLQLQFQQMPASTCSILSPSMMAHELPLYQDMAWCGSDFAGAGTSSSSPPSYGLFGFDGASMLDAEYMFAAPSSAAAASSTARSSSSGASIAPGRAGSPLATPMCAGSPISHSVFSTNGSVRTGSPLAWSSNTTASALQC